MKNLFLLLLSFGLLAGCKDRDPDPNVLPEATQTGANTAGALVDGKVWVASSSKKDDTYYQHSNSNGYSSIMIHLRNKVNDTTIYLQANIDDLEINKEYLLNQSSDSGNNYGGYFSTDSQWYSTQPNSVYVGKIKITTLDLSVTGHNYISGRFEFKGINANGTVVNITDGRFDKKIN